MLGARRRGDDNWGRGGRHGPPAFEILATNEGRITWRRTSTVLDAVTEIIGQPGIAGRTPLALSRAKRKLEGPAAVRLSEDRIKGAILHPDIEIRDRAASYFGKG